MDPKTRDRLRGCAVGAAVGDALGMPLEFKSPRPLDRLVREMVLGRLPAGTFTDDTEMALALAESLVERGRLEPQDVMERFVSWERAGPSDIGIHTGSVLARAAQGVPWEQAAGEVQRRKPDSAGNGSLMRCWPVAVAHWDDIADLVADSRLQSRITHPHAECVESCAFANAVIHGLVHGLSAAQAVERGLRLTDLPPGARTAVERAASRERGDLANSGWVRHTLESAVWGLLSSTSFEEAVVRVVNLGRDADTAGAVVGAWAGAAYGASQIPAQWRSVLRGEWPLGSGAQWDADRLAALADRLSGRG